MKNWPKSSPRMQGQLTTLAARITILGSSSSEVRKYGSMDSPMSDKYPTDQFTTEALETIEMHVLWCAVDALIQTHPNPAAVRKVFDQLIGQSTANLLVQGEPVGAFAVVRKLTERLFDE